MSRAGWTLRVLLLVCDSGAALRDHKSSGRVHRRCATGVELVDWLLAASSSVHSRQQAVGMWQALIEEGVLTHVSGEHAFRDKSLLYRFRQDAEEGGTGTLPSSEDILKAEDQLNASIVALVQRGPDAIMRMILRKP
uniref:DEP domain-containing protein n=1 Tax=Timema cristinae TaxID=61476 RepID=A0A7R9CFH5_TIMCR|nr:unnamed protein product [Timema cristinae]